MATPADFELSWDMLMERAGIGIRVSLDFFRFIFFLFFVRIGTGSEVSDGDELTMRLAFDAFFVGALFNSGSILTCTDASVG